LNLYLYKIKKIYYFHLQWNAYPILLLLLLLLLLPLFNYYY